MARVTADVERCQGHARCVLLAPDHFDTDADTAKVVLLKSEVSPDELSAVDEAVFTCPEAALALVDD